jgi:hypothetical protein
VADGPLNQFWSFATPITFLGTDSPESIPPAGYRASQYAFTSLWVTIKDVLGRAAAAKQAYEVPDDLLTNPDRLIGPDGLELRLNP